MRTVKIVFLALLAGIGFCLGGALDSTLSEPEEPRLLQAGRVTQALVSHDGKLTATILSDEQDRWYCQVRSHGEEAVGPLVILEPPNGAFHALHWSLDSQELFVELGSRTLRIRPYEGSVEPR